MKIEDYEKANDLSVEGDGLPLTNAEALMRIVDAFMNLPAMPEDLPKVLETRMQWRKMRNQTATWDKWTTKDLKLLLAVFVCVKEQVEMPVESLSAIITIRTLLEGE